MFFIVHFMLQDDIEVPSIRTRKELITSIFFCRPLGYNINEILSGGSNWKLKINNQTLCSKRQSSVEFENDDKLHDSFYQDFLLCLNIPVTKNIKIIIIAQLKT